jgi:hypothetical protein
MMSIAMMRPAVACRAALHRVMFTAVPTVSMSVAMFHPVMVVRRVLATVVIATGMIFMSMISAGVEVAVRRTTVLRRATELRAEAVRAGAAGAGVEPEVLRAAWSAVAEAGATREAGRTAMLEHPAELMPAVVLRRRLLRIGARAARCGVASGFVRRALCLAWRLP